MVSQPPFMFVQQLFQNIASRDHDISDLQDIAEQQGVNLSTVRNATEGNITLLHVASGFGRMTWVRVLIGDGADVNAMNDDGQTPLHAACKYAHKHIAQLLIDAGADVNLVDNKGWIALYYALSRHENIRKIQPHYWDVVELLLRNGANPYMKSNSGKNCFSQIYDDDQRLLVRINHLFKKLENCDNEESRERTIDKYLRAKDFFELVKTGDDNLDTLQALMTPRLLNSRLEPDNITPLHRAAGYNHFNTAKIFIQAGATVNATDKYGRIPLHNAAQYGHIEMIDLLIEEGSDKNKQDLDGYAPIHVAAQNKTFLTCKKLDDLGANIYIRTLAGELAYDFAESDDVRELLRPHKTVQRREIMTTKSGQPIYFGYQDDLPSDDEDGEPADKNLSETLMLNSRSNMRLFENPKYKSKIIPLDKSDHIYSLVETRMVDSKVSHANELGGRFREYAIVKIELILNEYVWFNYRTECRKLEQEFGRGFRNERLLFHGSKYIDKIKETGFDERHAQNNGMFGSGIYFAAHSSKSNQYTFGFNSGCYEHDDKSCYICERKMIYAQVALGKSLQAKQAMPDCSHAPPGHSSVSGDPQNIEDLAHPEFVIYKGEHAYPLFVITYRIKP